MKTNLLHDLPTYSSHEIFQTLLEQDGVRIERIVSTGQSSPPGFWYDQSQGEWVLLLSGAARLHFAEPEDVVELIPGDAVHIPPHRRHRVDWTHPDKPTVWLAVFHGG
ncbi:cupin 2 domain-containing protein [Formivibrio citricus]|uniref:Cupin 2 domain-containing protein n=1 Tax=Formivibrio citricus TaxID=83765 RepID=A0A1I5BKU3_9NEIS|nr:cupin domain-containing protein [Formivibrio citricus]SFN75323.1 cupin 2 domain-containing protein [Formivibrio citricus]